MTIEQANAYFASLPEGFASRRRCSGLPASLPAATTQAVSRSLPASG